MYGFRSQGFWETYEGGLLTITPTHADMHIRKSMTHTHTYVTSCNHFKTNLYHQQSLTIISRNDHHERPPRGY